MWIKSENAFFDEKTLSINPNSDKSGNASALPLRSVDNRPKYGKNIPAHPPMHRDGDPEKRGLFLFVDRFQLGFVGERHAAFDAAVVERIYDPGLQVAEEFHQIDQTADGEPHGG